MAKTKSPSKKSQVPRFLAMISATVLAISAFASWGSVKGSAITGMQGDGLITFILGLLAFLALALKKIPLYISIVIGILGLCISVWNLRAICTVMLEVNGSVDAGLYLSVIGSFFLIVFAAWQWHKK